MKNFISKQLLFTLLVAAFTTSAPAFAAQTTSIDNVDEALQQYYALAQQDDAVSFKKVLEERLAMRLFVRGEDQSPVMWSVCEQNERGWTILHQASNYKQLENVRVIAEVLTPQQFVTLVSIKNHSGRTALHYAALLNRLDIFQCMVEKAPLETILLSLTDQDTSGNTTFSYALKQSPEIKDYINRVRTENPAINVACAFIANPKEAFNSSNAHIWLSYLSPLQQMAHHGMTVDIQEYLGRRDQSENDNVKIICRQNIYGMTAMHHAVISGCLETVQEIYSHLSKEDLIHLLAIQDIRGKNPLMLAKELNQAILIDLIANLAIKTKSTHLTPPTRRVSPDNIFQQQPSTRNVSPLILEEDAPLEYDASMRKMPKKPTFRHKRYMDPTISSDLKSTGQGWATAFFLLAKNREGVKSARSRSLSPH